jgi:hypothetical protein
MATVRAELIRRLQRAYSGELGAALGYHGHAASLRGHAQRERVAQIEVEELAHRRRLGRMLARLGAQPSRALELRNRAIGLAIGLFCRVGGWYLPMYGAGWIERRNIAEYEILARVALAGGRRSWANDLLAMAEAEWEHELYFRTQAASHPLTRLVGTWPAPPPKNTLRQSFDDFARLVAAPIPWCALTAPSVNLPQPALSAAR